MLKEKFGKAELDLQTAFGDEFLYMHRSSFPGNTVPEVNGHERGEKAPKDLGVQGSEAPGDPIRAHVKSETILKTITR